MTCTYMPIESSSHNILHVHVHVYLLRVLSIPLPENSYYSSYYYHYFEKIRMIVLKHWNQIIKINPNRMKHGNEILTAAQLRLGRSSW